MKSCTKCGETKPLAEFHEHAPAPDGRRPTCIPCRRAYQSDYRKANPARCSAAGSLWRRNCRAAAIAFLGGMCVRCGEDDARMLQIDHVHGDGAVERREFRGSEGTFHRLIGDGQAEPGKHRLLCANCHCLRHA